MNLRDATLSGLPSIVGSCNSTVPSRTVTADTEPVSIESRLPWLHEQDPEGQPICIRGVEGEIAGGFSFEPFRKRSDYHATAEISVYVAANHRRKVIGKRLLAEALRHAPALGLKTLTPGVSAHSEPGLMLAGEFGFEPWAYFFPRVAELDGAERDLVFLGLRLDTETALG